MPIETTHPYRNTALRQLTDVHTRLERNDALLTQWSWARLSPSATVAPTYNRIANDLANAAASFRAVMPYHADVAARLVTDALSISRVAGQVDSMATRGAPFSRNGWSRVLDAPIRDVARAIDLLIDAR